MQFFQWGLPCDPTDLVYFRKRIGEKGVEKIFQASAALHGEKVQEREVIVDTTVQEKNITFPTDTKLRVKVMTRCWKMAREEKIQLRRSFRRELKKQLRTIRFSRSTRDRKKVAAAIRRVKTMAGALLRDIERKLSTRSRLSRKEEFALYHRVLSQEKHTKNKVYSLHEPGVLCIGKGKERKKYEFGSKAGLVMTKQGGILVGAKNFNRNVYDGDTLDTLLPQVASIKGSAPETAFRDRGFRGRTQVGATHIILPEAPALTDSASSRRKARKNFGRRNAIEPVIGHLKADFRMARNYLKGAIGDAINLLLAAAAFNFKKWMNALGAGAFVALFLLCRWICPVLSKQTANAR